MTDQTAPKTDIYETITNKIIAEIEKGVILPWRKPWDISNAIPNVAFPLRWNNIPYKGINVFMLWLTAAEQGYTAKHWLTFQQAKELGGSITKGEKSTMVVYTNKMEKEETDDEGQTTTKTIPYLKSYSVFNANQIENLPEEYYQVPASDTKPMPERISELEQFFSATKAKIVYGGDKAAYSVSADRIYMPHIQLFESALKFYSVQGHELVHWSRHPSRLNRDFGQKKWGDTGYAKEELVAELGNVMLASALGYAPESMDDHVAYIQTWLEALRNDKRLIVSAASHAQRAVDYLLAEAQPN